MVSGELLAALDLEQIERNIFRGLVPPNGPQRVFGGLVVAQALVAAARTVEGTCPAFPSRLFHPAGRSLDPDRL